jgi:uncharacterized lipoprotein YbaY
MELSRRPLRRSRRSAEESGPSARVVVVLVAVIAEGERPPSGAPLLVEVLDTTYADAPAEAISRAHGRVADGDSTLLATLELDTELVAGRDYRVRAHVDVAGNGAVSPGDFVTTRAHPARSDRTLEVLVKKV